MTESFYQKFMESRFRKPVGVILIILGFLALVTPFTPGAWLAFIGLELLGLRLAFNRQVLRLRQMFTRKKHEIQEKQQTNNAPAQEEDKE